MLHAHPDDELLFAGALMLSRSWAWQTVSLTAGVRAHRYPGLSLGFEDIPKVLTRAEYEEWRDAVWRLDLHPDIVVTHNRLGEYGHPHHMAVHAIAHELFGAVWDFYVTAPSSVGPQEHRGRLRSLPVTPAKRALLEATYPGVVDELRTYQPTLVASLFEAEVFTF